MDGRQRGRESKPNVSGKGMSRPKAPRTRRTDEDGFWDAQDVADYLKVTAYYVRRQANQGIIPSIQIPGSVIRRYDPKVIKAWVLGRSSTAKD